MGCQSVSAKYQQKLESLSNGKLDKRSVESIKMNTYFEEKELYFLYERFLKLNPNESGCIANNQLLSMHEFKYCALKDHLSRALCLEIDLDMFKTKEEPLVLKEGKKEDDAVLTVKDGEEENKTEKLVLKDDENKEHRRVESINKEDKDKNDTKEMIKPKDEKLIEEKKADGKVLTGEDKAEGELVIAQGKQYIDFKKFCNLMKIFNTRTPIDEKVNFYFRLYDVDNDGKISKLDFRRILINLVPDDMLEEDKVNLNNNAKENVEKIVNLMFKEIVGNEKRKFIEYDEFQKILWQTNIDKTCLIHFDAV